MGDKMTVKEIIFDWLKNHGYDGLYEEKGCCGCCLADFMPCDEDGGILDCEPGYLDDKGDDDAPYYIRKEKPEVG